MHAFGNSFGQAGGEALAQALESNTTLEEVSVGNVIKDSTVRLKSSGEMCTVHRFYGGDGNPCITKPDGSTQDDVKPAEFDPIPAVLPVKQLRDNAITELNLKNSSLGIDGGIMVAAMLKTNASVTKVSAILCAEKAIDGHVFLVLQPSLSCVMLVAFGVAS